jgi:hypothetical protein
MDAEEFFATRWPAMVPSLRAALARAGASPSDREDLVQDTAMRLLGMWAEIDWERPVEALARRIAINAFRDQWRRRGDREILGALPEEAAYDDTERAAVARLEVREVSRALASLPAQTARVLRVAAEESEGPALGPVAPAVRMARTRARRALVACLKVASAVAAAFVFGARHLVRSARFSAAGVTAMGAVACVLLLNISHPGGPGSKLPALITGSGQTTVDLATHQVTVGEAAGATGAAARLNAARHGLRSHAKVANKVPYYRIKAGPAEVDTFINVDIQGHGFRVSRPQPGSDVPACTYGSSPTFPVVPRC